MNYENAEFWVIFPVYLVSYADNFHFEAPVECFGVLASVSLEMDLKNNFCSSNSFYFALTFCQR